MGLFILGSPPQQRFVYTGPATQLCATACLSWGRPPAVQSVAPAAQPKTETPTSGGGSPNTQKEQQQRRPKREGKAASQVRAKGITLLPPRQARAAACSRGQPRLRNNPQPGRTLHEILAAAQPARPLFQLLACVAAGPVCWSAGHCPSGLPSVPSHLFRTLALRRLRLPFPISDRACRCRRRSR